MVTYLSLAPPSSHPSVASNTRTMQPGPIAGDTYRHCLKGKMEVAWNRTLFAIRFAGPRAPPDLVRLVDLGF